MVLVRRTFPIAACSPATLGWTQVAIFFLALLVSFPSACLGVQFDSSDSLPMLIKELSATDGTRRIDATKRLAKLGDRASMAAPALMRCLREGDIDLRVHAAYALACVRGDVADSMQSLIPLLHDANEHVRYSAEWSLAHLASTLPAEMAAPQRQQILGMVEHSLRIFQGLNPLPQHQTMLELAKAKLDTINSPIEVAPPPPSQTAANEEEILETVQAAYHANDRLGRLRFIHRLVDQNLDNEAIRLSVLRVEAEEADATMLSLALQFWGEAGQRTLAKWLETIPKQTMLGERETRLVEQVIPHSESMNQRLMEWSQNPELDNEFRCAALAALGRTKLPTKQVLDALQRLVHAPDPSLAGSAIDSLGALGTVAQVVEPHLIAAYRQTEDESLRISIIDALLKISPRSSSAAKAMVDWLQQVDTDTFHFTTLLNACAEYGPLASSAIPRMTEWLQSPNVDVRYQATEALSHMGPSVDMAKDLLIQRLFDPQEEIRTKNQIIRALQQLDTSVVQRVLTQIPRDDESACESALHAFAMFGPAASETSEFCFQCLQDPNRSCATRTAAAQAIGAFGPSQTHQVPSLIQIARSDEPELLRASCLIAAARIAPDTVQADARELMEFESKLISASAAYSLHLGGNTRDAFAKLLDLLDESDADTVIKQTLSDLGPTAHAWITEVACDPSASDLHRIACCDLASSLPNPDWSLLLPLVDDPNLGDRFTDYLVYPWHTHMLDELEGHSEELRTLLEFMNSSTLTPVGHARLASLLTPDGLGAGEDMEDWAGLHLTQPSNAMLLTEAPAMAAVEAEPSAEGQEEARRASKKRMDPLAEHPPLLDDAELSQSRSRASLNPLEKTDSVKEVLVLYGTNRSRSSTEHKMQDVVSSVMGATAGCICLLGLCFVGFVRAGNRWLATLTLLGIFVFGPIGFYAAYQISKQSWSTPVVFSGDYRNQVEYGSCTVSIPPHHQPGALESPNLFRFEVTPDPEQHVVLAEIKPLSEERFYQQMQQLQAEKGKNLLVFIHGYNVSFEDAARRTAQMSFDLKFPGAPVFYSWPSQANWYGYATDQANIRDSVQLIKTFLTDLAQKSGADTINLVAHSMGNVGLTEALKEMANATSEPLFNQVVLAAPDIDTDVFRDEIAPSIIGKARRLTLYTSKSDLALVASRYFNRGSRAGDSASELLLIPGIETIDATNVDSSLLGHSYYGSSVSVLTDLENLLKNQPIQERPYLRRSVATTEPYWEFDPVMITRMPKPEKASVR